MFGQRKRSVDDVTKKKEWRNTECHCPCWKGGQKSDSRNLGQWEHKGPDIKERLEVVERHPLSQDQWKKRNLTVRRWESEKHKSWVIPVEGFWKHGVTDGSLLGVSGKWSACGWSVVQVDQDEEMGPMHGVWDTGCRA